MAEIIPVVTPSIKAIVSAHVPNIMEFQIAPVLKELNIFPEVKLFQIVPALNAFPNISSFTS